MKDLAKGILRRIVLLGALGLSVCAYNNARVPPSKGAVQAKQEAVVAQQSTTIDKKVEEVKFSDKLEFIKEFMRARDMKSIVFGSPYQKAMLALEDIDKDKKTDYVVVWGEQSDKPTPFSPTGWTPQLLYLEDRSKVSAPGILDKAAYYDDEKDGVKRAVWVTMEDMLALFKQYNEAKVKQNLSPDELKALAEKTLMKRAHLMQAQKMYNTTVNSLYEMLKSEE